MTIGDLIDAIEGSYLGSKLKAELIKEVTEIVDHQLQRELKDELQQRRGCEQIKWQHSKE